MSFEKNVRRNFINYVLFDALDDENLRNVEYLLAVKKADPNGYLEDLDLCPMHCAVGAGTEDFAYQATNLCLKYGGDPNIKNAEGNTPLHIAAWWGRRKVAELLLKCGGDPLISDGDGNNALDLALANKQEHLYSRFVLHKWMPQKCFEQDEKTIHKKEFQSEEASYKEWWKHSAVQVPKNSPFSSDLEQITFTDIESDVNFVEIFIPNTKTLLSSSLASVPSVKRSFSDTSNMIRFRNTGASSSSALSRCSSAQSIPSIKSEGSVKSWATEYVRGELKRLNIFCGPVVKSTKRLYIRQLKRIMENPKMADLFKLNSDGFNEVMASTFGPRLPELLTKWSPLFDEMTQCCMDQPGRGSKERCFFTYVLLDPLITCNLPARIHNLSQWESWTTFVKAVFYIGKGKNSRPMAHLYDAVKAGNQFSEKIARIRYIWSVGKGVVCVQAFHNLTEAEAYNREAAMLDALRGYKQLTNLQSGDYSGKMKYWGMKEKKRLGVLLLYRTMQIYVADHERQIHPSDLKL